MFQKHISLTILHFYFTFYILYFYIFTFLYFIFLILMRNLIICHFTRNNRIPFNVTIIVAPMSAKMAIQSVSQPGITSSKGDDFQD